MSKWSFSVILGVIQYKNVPGSCLVCAKIHIRFFGLCYFVCRDTCKMYCADIFILFKK